MCHGFSHFSSCVHYFVLVHLATSSIKVNMEITLGKSFVDDTIPQNDADSSEKVLRWRSNVLGF